MKLLNYIYRNALKKLQTYTRSKILDKEFEYKCYTELGTSRMIKLLLKIGCHSPSLVKYNGIMYSFTIKTNKWNNNYE